MPQPRPPLVLSPPDTPFTLKVENNPDTDIQSDSEELAVLDKVLHITQNVSLCCTTVVVLKYQTKSGVALTLIMRTVTPMA